MKRIAWMVVGIVAASLVLTGCEWDTGSDATSWSSSYNWVNFSGTYRSSGNLGVLVTDYTVTPDFPAATTDRTVRDESQGSFRAGSSSISGKLRNEPVVAGSVVVRLFDNGGRLVRSYADNGEGILGDNEGNIQYPSGAWSVNLAPVAESNFVTAVSSEPQGRFTARSSAFSGQLTQANIVPGSLVIEFRNNSGTVIRSVADNGAGQLGANGAIQYISGAWTVDFGLDQIFVEDGNIVARYSYTRTLPQEVSAGGYVTASYTYGSTTQVRPGSTGATIHSFDVNQLGQNLTITDNNGAVFTGYISQMRSASGAESGTEIDRAMPQENDTIIASFECSGTSAAGYPVRIVGTLQGTVRINSASSGVFRDRVMNGTWIESGGTTGDINGKSSDIQIQMPTGTTDPAI